MRLLILSLSTLFVIVFISSCGGGAGTEKTTDTDTIQPSQTAADKGSQDSLTMMTRGEKIYKEKCVACHQLDAKGLKGAFPPLAQSDYLLTDPRRGIEQVLNGSHIEMIVNGEKYNQPMTPQVDTKEDALAVINYVLKNFGNNAPMVKPEDIVDITIKPRK